MRSQASKGFSEKMAATGSDDATATFKGDMEKDFGQEANQEKAKAKSDDAKASGKTSGKAKDDAAKNRGKDADGEAEGDDDAAKNQGKDADGEAEDEDDAAKNQGKDVDGEASRDDKEAFVSPEEPYKSARLAWEARVAAVEAREDFPPKGKVPDARAQVGKAVGKAEVGARSRTTSQRIKPGQMTMTPEMSKMIDDEVEKRLKQRLNQDEPPKEVRKRLNFQSDDDDLKDLDRQQREAYDQRVETLIQADEKKKADREAKEMKKMQEMFEMFLEKKAKDEEQQRLKRRWQEEKSREDAKRLKEQQEKEKKRKSQDKLMS